jgi:hypothetical protein
MAARLIHAAQISDGRRATVILGGDLTGTDASKNPGSRPDGSSRLGPRAASRGAGPCASVRVPAGSRAVALVHHRRGELRVPRSSHSAQKRAVESKWERDGTQDRASQILDSRSGPPMLVDDAVRSCPILNADLAIALSGDWLTVSLIAMILSCEPH